MEINIWILIAVAIIIFALFYLCLASIYKLIIRVTELEKRLQMTIGNVIRVQNNLNNIFNVIYKLDELKGTIDSKESENQENDLST